VAIVLDGPVQRGRAVEPSTATGSRSGRWMNAAVRGRTVRGSYRPRSMRNAVLSNT